MDKNRVKICKIKLNKPPFTDIEFEPTNINFIFGKNGTGKSTIGRCIRDDIGLELIDDGSTATVSQVFNDEYIRKNIGGDMDGVFTISEADIETEERIKVINSELERIKNERQQKIDDKKNAEKSKSDFLASAQASCWDCTRDFVKKFSHKAANNANKGELFKQLCTVTPVSHTIDEILNLEKLAYDSSLKSIPLLPLLTFPSLDLTILETSIVALKETQFSLFMKSMGDDVMDWVYKGHINFEKIAGGKCPYCQKPLEKETANEIEQAFDVSYTNALDALTKLQSTEFPYYQFEIKKQISSLRTLDGFKFIDEIKFKSYVTSIELGLNKIESAIQRKSSTPSSKEKAELVDNYIAEINTLIHLANTAIQEQNDALSASIDKKGAYEKAYREAMAFLCKAYIHDYCAGKGAKEKAVTDLDTEISSLNKQEITYKEELSSLNAKTTSTAPVIDKIKNLLENSGFSSFTIAPAGPRNYKLVRPDNSDASFLSEGEKNFICFLYFYYSVFGVLKEEDGYNDRIVVIDDPVSSMDSDAVFIIAELVRNIIEATINAFKPVPDTDIPTNIKQVFILTHNSFFYNEIAPMYVSNYEIASFFEIIKEGTDSKVVLNTEIINKGAVNEREVNFIPDIGDYSSLWEIYRTTENPRILMNTMRRILEQYFLHNLGYTSGDLRKCILTTGESKFTTPEDLVLARAMVNYVANDSVSSINFSTYTNDILRLKAVFSTLFDILGQKQHHDMMANK